MKQQKILSYLLLLSAILTITLISCKGQKNDRTIIYDEKRASEEVIPIDQAIQLQNNFIQGRAELTRLVRDSSFLTKRFNLSNAESFNRDAIALLLNQKDADGIRIYLGDDGNGKIRLVLLPVDAKGNDIITTLIGNTSRSTGFKIPGVSSAQAAPPASAQAVETGQICPTCSIKK